MSSDPMNDGWACPICGGTEWRPRFGVDGTRTEGGVSAESFVPSSSRFGTTAGTVVRCIQCGHGSLLAIPSVRTIDDAYEGAADPVSIREEAGQVATATRDLAMVERWVKPGRLLDVGCWTGSFLVAARARGWTVEGIEPSEWAVARAVQRGVDVSLGTLDNSTAPRRAFRAVVACDVVEHLVDPGAAIERMADLLEPGGALFLTVPDAGSRLARAMGRRWWSVLPMHLQYFTRASMETLLESRGLRVRSIATHSKVFAGRYYAERVAEFVPVVGKLAPTVINRTRWADRLVAPDFRDRMAVIAIKNERDIARLRTAPRP